MNPRTPLAAEYSAAETMARSVKLVRNELSVGL